MIRKREIPKKLQPLYESLSKRVTSSKLTFIFMGIASTIWFLIRVIPKPSRAVYPCMRAAAPIMSGFVIYLLGVTSTALLFKQAKRFLLTSRYLIAGVMLIATFITSFSLKSFNEKPALAATQTIFEANQPIGEAKGAVPGRVVWVHDPDATNENMTNTDGDYWFQNTNQEIVDKMMNSGILRLTNESTIEEAWDTLFRDFNLRRYGTNKGYTAGEKVVIKLNITTSCCGSWDGPTKKTGWLDHMDATPQVALALLKQLVDVAGVAQSDIYIGDPYRTFHDVYWDICHPVYPDVNYVDQKGENGRLQTVASAEQVLKFSDGKETSSLPQTYLDGTYFINMPCLKTHNEGGITVGAKNHQGSILYPGDNVKSQSAQYMHYSLPANSEGTGKYRHTVDYLGHKDMGGKTLLTIIDGIWAGKNWSGIVEKWAMYPFNDDYPSSLLISQDVVAADAVAYDFLLEEYSLRTSDLFPYIDGAGDYLAQAADPAYWAEGITYDPEGDGTPLGSLGVYEHWNNSIDKQYSRNLGTGNGIELVYVPMQNVAPQILKEISDVSYENTTTDMVVIDDLHDYFIDFNKDTMLFTVDTDNENLMVEVTEDNSLKIRSEVNFIDNVTITVTAADDESDVSMEFNVVVNTGEKYRAPFAETAPTIDGTGDEAIWADAPWTLMNQVWLPYGSEVDPADISPKYKVVWTADHIYILAEVIDDVLDANNQNPLSNYYKYDCLEFFIDEDKSGGDHTYSYNAFAYHVSAEGNSVDLGTDKSPHLYSDHVTMAMTNTGNTYFWEVAIAIYDDSFEYDGANTPVTLEAGKELGFSLAYCDADNPANEERENFMGSVYVTEDKQNAHWQDASEFGSLTLIGAGNTNSSPYLKAAIDNIVLSENGNETILIADLNTVFGDPDDDVLSFIASEDNNEITVDVVDNALIITTTEMYDGTTVITVEASDEMFTVEESFEVFFDKNDAPALEASVDDVVVEELNKTYTAVADLTELFSDADNDELTFTVEPSNADLQTALYDDVQVLVKLRNEATSPITVTITASDGELETSVSFQVRYEPVGINDLRLFEQSVICYPNPVQDHMNLVIENDISGEFHVSIFTSNGKMVQHEVLHKSNSTIKHKLNTASLAKGIYLMEIRTGEYSTTKYLFK